MNIPMSEIRRQAGVQAFLRGNRIPSSRIGEIEVVYNTPMEVHISASVEGSGGNVYRTHVYFREDTKEIVDYMCDCLAAEKYTGMCKHCVALALQFSMEQLTFMAPQQRIEVELKTDFGLRELLYQKNIRKKAAFLQPAIMGSIELETKIAVKWDYDENQYLWRANFKVGNAAHMYVMKNVGEFLKAVQQNESLRYGVKLEFLHVREAFTPKAQQLIEAMLAIETINKKMLGIERGYGGSRIFPFEYERSKELLIKEGAKHILLQALVGGSFELQKDYATAYSCPVLQENPKLECSLTFHKDKRNYVLELPALGLIEGGKRLFVEKNQKIYQCDENFTRDMLEICRLAQRDKKKKMIIHKNDMPAFCSNVLPLLKQYMDFVVLEELEDFLIPEVEIKIYLDKNREQISCKIEAVYANETFLVNQRIDVEHSYRDLEREQGAYLLVKNYFSKKGDNGFMLGLPLEWEDEVYELLTVGLAQFKNVGEVYISQELKKLKVYSAPKVSVGVSISAGLLDLQLDVGDFPVEELEGVLEQYRKRKKFYRLKNGEFVGIQDNSLGVVAELSQGLNLKGKELQKSHVQLPAFRALYLDQLLNQEEQDLVEVKREKSFKGLIRSIKTFEDSDFEVPESLETIMRGYQKTGYRWLRTLEHLGFGGILADDMGLGKSIQFISLLLGKKREQEEILPSLIVCPASLVYNWESELQKFGPKLTVLILAGTAKERREAIGLYKNFDVLVTSYDLLKRDVEVYQEEQAKFGIMVIDEAQNIKNHLTQVAKAVKEIPATLRYALTGTPIENRLSELWSIFDFLMPGLLYSYTKFKREFELPIVQNNDEVAGARLRRMIKPFIMRRTKDEVLKELPAKVEEVICSKLEGKQKELYIAQANQIKESLGRTSNEEFNKNKLRILAEMTKLRQICCDPRLLYEDYEGESAKLDTCMELVKNAVEAGHKVLLFSQFISVFDLLEKSLYEMGISYFRLDGSTPKVKRVELVETFNQDHTNLFLISLKAGGTGLNLTSASIVIHFDPWWNFAAQNQATDRAHRIGQEKRVTVYKLIAKNTIEERILKLQEAKRKLSEEIINEGGSTTVNFTQDDLVALLETQ